jgi:hypothetical protein
MTPRTALDVLRSTHKYVASMLPDEWEVRLWDGEGEFNRPFARVAKVGPLLARGPAWYTDVTQPMVVHSYPVPQETVEHSIFAAEEVEELLHEGFRVGIPPLGYPLRIPLWDWTGVPLDGPNSDSVERLDHDYIRIAPDSLQINRLHEPVDDRLITVVTEMRVTWRRPGLPRRTVPRKTVESVITDFDPVR